MNNIEQILSELYEIDPGLKQYEEQVKKIISEMLVNQPDTKFDSAFAASLKQRLMQKSENPKTAKFFINLNFMREHVRVFAGALVALVLIFVGYSLPRKDGTLPLNKIVELTKSEQEQDKQKQAEVKKFSSKAEFLAYLEQSQSSAVFGMGGIGGGAPLAESRNMAFESAPMGLSDSSGAAKLVAPAPGRGSDTNVQSKGIDEPDIVKTNGNEIFVSTPNYYIYNQPLTKAMPESMPIEGDLRIWPPQQSVGETKVINALPADQIKQIGKLSRQGEM